MTNVQPPAEWIRLPRRRTGVIDAAFIRDRSQHDGNGCWIWRGQRSNSGYGRLTVWREGRACGVLAHRASYEIFQGPIPDGLHIDHLCRVRLCVNPDHLEPVTRQENIRRGMTAGAIAVRTNRCKRGHEYTEGSFYLKKTGSRACKKCASIRGAEYYAARKAGA